jgi:hypothetical protein
VNIEFQIRFRLWNDFGFGLLRHLRSYLNFMSRARNCIDKRADVKFEKNGKFLSPKVSQLVKNGENG